MKYMKALGILTYNELDQSLPGCLPACLPVSTSNTIATAGLEKDRVGYLDRLSLSSESL
jgi:hypothetical protein